MFGYNIYQGIRGAFVYIRALLCIGQTLKHITYRGALCFVLLALCYSGDHIKKNEMGRACSKYGEKCIEGFGWET
jgi:hypothetical protein